MRISRRALLAGGTALGGALATGCWPSVAFGAPATGRESILVVIFLRGGIDGLQFAGPSEDPDYIAARPESLRVLAEGDTKGLPLAQAPRGDFRLHPNASPLHELYTAGDLALVHACGVPTASRSHFVVQDLMEHGGGNEKGGKLNSGWLARYAQSADFGGILPIVSIGAAAPLSLLGATGAVSMQSVGRFNLVGRGPVKARLSTALTQMYAGPERIAAQGAQTLRTLEQVASRLPEPIADGGSTYTPRPGVTYPTGQGDTARFGEQLQSVAQLIRLELGVRIATVNVGGWDTHQGQTTRLPELIGGLSGGIHALWDDLEEYQDRLTIVVMSEFGRRIYANNSEGTDHGRGTVMLALGKGIRGGRMYGPWPGLGTEQLDNQRDLMVTTDYRTVLGELLQQRAGATDVGAIFPGAPLTPLGLAS